MLEEIRSKLMTMQYKNASSVSGAQLKLCPKINEKQEQLKYYSRHCTCSLLEMVVFKLEIEVFNLLSICPPRVAVVGHGISLVYHANMHVPQLYF